VKIPLYCMMLKLFGLRLEELLDRL
jgi:hypothetical protein